MFSNGNENNHRLEDILNHQLQVLACIMNDHTGIIKALGLEHGAMNRRIIFTLFVDVHKADDLNFLSWCSHVLYQLHINSNKECTNILCSIRVILKDTGNNGIT